MTTIAVRLITVVAVLTALFGSFGVASAASPTPQGTQTAGAATPAGTATPAVRPPVAPSNVVIDLAVRTITWQDNSDDETGFVIMYAVEGTTTVSATYSVGPNTTSFIIPQSAPSFSCGQTLKISIAAVNGNVSSALATNGLSSICPPPTATGNDRAVGLPPTGTPPTGGDPFGLVAAAVAVLMSGCVLVTLGMGNR